MSALQRHAIGAFFGAEAIAFESLTASSIEANLISPYEAVRELPPIVLSEEQIARVSHGQVISVDSKKLADEIAAFDSRANLIAILKPAGNGQLTPTKCFTTAAEN